MVVVNDISTVANTVKVIMDGAGYYHGQTILVKMANTTTGASTLSVSGRVAIVIKKQHDIDIESGDLEANQIVKFIYNSVSNTFETLTERAVDILSTLTLTPLTGIIKGDGANVSVAVAGTDYVAPNAAVVGATKTKITYDSKGLVTVGEDATTADISASTDKNYVTDADLVVLSNTSNTNSGDNATNSQYSSLVTNATHTGDATGDTALTVVAINGTSMAGLATGILKNTTTTGVPSIAIASDFPTLNQSTTGNADTATNSTQIGGITVSGVPTIGQVLTATSATTATWQ